MAGSGFLDIDIMPDGDSNSDTLKSSYYDLDEFNTIMRKQNNENNLSILNLNARSIVKHIHM